MIDSIKQVGSLYGSTIKELQMQAIEHLRQWSPKQYKRLKASDRLLPTTLRAAKREHKEISQVMRPGSSATRLVYA